MVGLGRLELPTSRLSGVRSNHLSYKPLGFLTIILIKRIYRQQIKFCIYIFFLWKEVIQPQVPLRLPCYDLAPVADPTVVARLPCGLPQRLQAEPTPMAWRAVCTRPGNVFTAARWSAITSDSNFMFSSCREQSELRQLLKICSTSRSRVPL